MLIKKTMNTTMNTTSYTYGQDCKIFIINDFIQQSDDLYIEILRIEFENLGNKPRLSALFNSDLPQHINALITKLSFIGSQLNYKNIPENCQVNYYRNGNDYHGWTPFNADVVYVISIGCSRLLEIRDNLSSLVTIVLLKPNSLIIIKNLNHSYHIPKDETAKSTMMLMYF